MIIHLERSIYLRLLLISRAIFISDDLVIHVDNDFAHLRASLCLSCFVWGGRQASRPRTSWNASLWGFDSFFLFHWGYFGFRIILIIPFIDCHSHNHIIMMKVMFEEEDRPTNHKPVENYCSGCWRTVYHLGKGSTEKNVFFRALPE